MANENDDDLRPEYDLSQLKGRVQGKYYKRATSGATLALVESDSTDLFSDAGSLDRDLLTALLGHTKPLKPVEWLQTAIHSTGSLLADPYVETRSRAG